MPDCGLVQKDSQKAAPSPPHLLEQWAQSHHLDMALSVHLWVSSEAAKCQACWEGGAGITQSSLEMRRAAQAQACISAPQATALCQLNANETHKRSKSSIGFPFHTDYLP